MTNPLSVNSRVSTKSNYGRGRVSWQRTAGTALVHTLWSGTCSRFHFGPEQHIDMVKLCCGEVKGGTNRRENETQTTVGVVGWTSRWKGA